ncbi:MAG: 6,7-dimethyl-8-ribityllumazine synthase [Spirochaetia bacterium]|nr:6,7-dimethyl-8-ribityllumazine synthase [Spirochaetia bacterium]
MKNFTTYETDTEKDSFNIAIVISEYNIRITEALLRGALRFLENVNCEPTAVYKTAGAFEIPLVCKKIFSSQKADGIIALGAVIRGDTPHFDYVCNEASRGVMNVSLEKEKPIAFGVLTTDNIEQAIRRAGEDEDNKGYEAAQSLWQTLRLIKKAKI